MHFYKSTYLSNASKCGSLINLMFASLTVYQWVKIVIVISCASATILVLHSNIHFIR